MPIRATPRLLLPSVFTAALLGLTACGDGGEAAKTAGDKPAAKKTDANKPVDAKPGQGNALDNTIASTDPEVSPTIPTASITLAPPDAETLAGWNENVYPNGVRFFYPKEAQVGGGDAVRVFDFDTHKPVVVVYNPAKNETDPAADWIAKDILELSRLDNTFSRTGSKLHPPEPVKTSAGSAAMYRISESIQIDGAELQSEAFVYATIHNDVLYLVGAIQNDGDQEPLAVDTARKMFSTLIAGDPPKPDIDDPRMACTFFGPDLRTYKDDARSISPMFYSLHPDGTMYAGPSKNDFKAQSNEDAPELVLVPKDPDAGRVVKGTWHTRKGELLLEFDGRYHGFKYQRPTDHPDRVYILNLSRRPLGMQVLTSSEWYHPKPSEILEESSDAPPTRPVDPTRTNPVPTPSPTLPPAPVEIHPQGSPFDRAKD